MKKIGFYVIGGQYAPYCYGGTPTLLGAKRLANKSQEYWDNHRGWHTPSIYRVEDTELVWSEHYGDDVRSPKQGAHPVDW